jgi:threonine/homoserine/homoserine lactone efflux protein
MTDPWPQIALFILRAVVISLSGVLSPGAMTAAALVAGTRSPHAGFLMAIGHGIVEFPLMLLILAGIGEVFANGGVKIAVGLAGGIMLLWLAVGMLKDPGARAASSSAGRLAGSPIVTGIVLTGGNPVFLLWWATVGLSLAVGFRQLGAAAFAAFAVIHWACDAIWLELLTVAAFKGSRLLGEKSQRVILALCGLALFVIAGGFLYGAVSQLYGTIR